MGIFSRCKDIIASAIKKGPEAPAIEFGAATAVRRFRANQEENYRNQLSLFKTLVDEKFYPKVKIYSLEGSANEEFPYLIVITGEKANFIQTQSKIGFLARKQEEIINNQYGDNVSVLTPHSSVKNTPGEGESIYAMGYFNQTMSLIKAGKYKITNYLYSDDQSKNLDDTIDEYEKAKSYYIKKYANRLITHTSSTEGCGDKQFRFGETLNIYLHSSREYFQYMCPLCRNPNIFTAITIENLEKAPEAPPATAPDQGAGADDTSGA